ncbi:hypothetical protein [uncultured Duncaniella sp.]|uniref:hypothetical protein n=1 Tax=uncultured Duncaniella sp. TaxID=2768039 RepID=UPI0025DFB294|nr:hypothetical protein [uncultured Duncaniella sp.]
MEIFSRHEHEKDSSCRRHHLLHCILHATLQVATLAAALITLNEVDKLRKDVKLIRRK